MQVLKYELVPHGEIQINAPLLTQPIKVLFQNEILQVWAEVAESEDTVHTFMVIHTGEEFDDTDWMYIDTAMNFDHSYVVHVYYKLDNNRIWGAAMAE